MKKNSITCRMPLTKDVELGIKVLNQNTLRCLTKFEKNLQENNASLCGKLGSSANLLAVSLQ